MLVNAYTASASEITAGAIEDNGVGTLVGTKTFGKGVVQTIFPLRDGSAVKITTARYFTPDGHDINTVGIQPQIEALIPKDEKIRPGYPAARPRDRVPARKDRERERRRHDGGHGPTASPLTAEQRRLHLAE